MQKNHNKWQKIWRLFLLALLYAAQQAVLAAHPYEHDVKSDHVDCHICIVAKSSAGPAVEVSQFIQPRFSIENPMDHGSTFLPFSIRWTTARSPPLYYLIRI